jgi:hypothetical protein
MKGRSSQIRVDHDSGGIDHPAQPGAYLEMDLLLEERVEVLEREEGLVKLRGLFLMEKFFPEEAQTLSDGTDHYGARVDLQEIHDLGP